MIGMDGCPVRILVSERWVQQNQGYGGKIQNPKSFLKRRVLRVESLDFDRLLDFPFSQLG